MSIAPPPPRLSSLDQFRGYTVLGMVFVNFVGGAEAVPAVFKHHHTYCSYADTIMPQFLFAVGFAMRLTLLRRAREGSTRAALARAVWRSLGLILLGVVVYRLGGQYRTWDELVGTDPGTLLVRAFKRQPFEALVHIGVTALRALPVVLAPKWVRVLFAVASAGLHVYLSLTWYYQWNLTPPVGIDGGPLGFLSWTVPLIAGTLAHDWVAGPADPNEGRTAKLVAAGVLLMALGYALSCLNRWNPPNAWVTTDAWWRDQLADPPFVPLSESFRLNYWVMSQRAGSVTYTTFAAGFALVVYAAFRVACDRYRLRWGYLDLFGRHALAAYVIHEMVDRLVSQYLPGKAPLWYVLAAFAVYLAAITVFLRYLDRHGIVFRL